MRTPLLFALLVVGGAQLSEAQTTIRARVVAIDSRKPVAGALVRDLTSTASAISDGNGEWRLTTESDSIRLLVEHIAYVSAARTIGPQRNDVVFMLVPSVTEMEAVVVTASRRMQKLKDAPVATELITRRDIEQTGGSDAAAVLLERTGIELEGGHPAGNGAMLQGFGAERVLVLLDGQPLVGRMSGSFDLTRIPAGMLERVEVVKGPQSTLFGSDALGGVINLITRETNQPLAASAEVTSGTQDRLDVSGRLHGAVGDASFLIDAGHREIGLTPGLARDAGANNAQWDVLLKGGMAFSPNARVEASALLVDESQRWQTGQLFSFADNVQRAGRLTSSLHVRGHTFTPTIAASEFRHTPARSSTEEITVPGITEKQQLREVELLHSFAAGKLVLDNGVEMRDELLVSPNIQGGERSLSGLDAYTQLTWSVGRLDLVPGVRLSTSEAWGTHWTPRVAVLYRASESVVLRASVGSAYRSPAFKELFMSFLNLGAGVGYVVRGNEQLSPESSTNISLGAEFIRPRYYARVQLFHNRFSDFIETQVAGDSAGLTVYSYGNIADGITRGGEVEVNTSWKAARFEIGYSYLDTHDNATGGVLLGRPAHTGRMTAGYTFASGTRVSATAIHTGATPMQRTEDTLLTRDAYTRLDTRIAHALPYGLELSIGVNNLTDTTPALWPGYTGRQVYVGASWRSTDKGTR